MPPAIAREIESKFDVAPDYELPSFDGFHGPDGRVEVDEVFLSSTYYDTGDLDLLRYRLTLRRREGDADTGWHLKVPGNGFRTEVRWPLEGAEPPAELAGLLRPFVGGSTPSEIVRLDVTRTRHRILDADGALIAEVARDDVRAHALGGEVRAPRWHEVEVELGPAGDADALEALSAAVQKAGAYASTSRSKLARALLGIGNEGLGTPRTSAGAVLIDYIAAQSDAIVAGHFAISRDAKDSIHQTRVAGRRLRSTLRTFEALFDQQQAIELENELKWYADVLGEVRDREVLRARLTAAIKDLPSELVVGPVAEQIDLRLAREIAQRRADALEVMAGERYAALLATVTHWRDDPPFTAAAGRPADTLHDAVDGAEHRLGKRLRAATKPAGTDAQLHRARKAGKRVRYAVEATDGEQSIEIARWKEIQDLLGEFQDSVVATEILRRLADDAWSHGENGFTYGVLLASERSNADRIRAEARAAPKMN